MVTNDVFCMDKKKTLRHFSKYPFYAPLKKVKWAWNVLSLAVLYNSLFQIDVILSSKQCFCTWPFLLPLRLIVFHINLAKTTGASHKNCWSFFLAIIVEMFDIFWRSLYRNWLSEINPPCKNIQWNPKKCTSNPHLSKMNTRGKDAVIRDSSRKQSSD